MRFTEELARTICCPEGCMRGTGPVTPCVAPRLRRSANAALKLVLDRLEQPSDEMIGAGQDEPTALMPDDDIAPIWEAMLAVARKELEA